jgi:peptide deformylase
MAKYELLQPSDMRLNGISREVRTEEVGSEPLETLLDAMRTLALNERDKEKPQRRTLVGLAAPQVGAFLRIILFDKSASADRPNFNPDIRFLINPRIVTAASEEVLGREGCYSSGEVCGAVYRARSISAVALDVAGKEVQYDLTDFQARIIQHEIDHLNGIRFPDRVRRPEHLHQVGANDFQAYRGHWQTWQEFYPLEKWLKIKNGKG